MIVHVPGLVGKCVQQRGRNGLAGAEVGPLAEGGVRGAVDLHCDMDLLSHGHRQTSELGGGGGGEERGE